VAELVVQAHRGRAEDAPAEPRPVQRLRTGIEVGAVGGQSREQQAKARAPSSAISDVIGEASGAYRPSTACASAFMPLVAVSSAGIEIVREGS
jgi:hypothetical protein